MKEATTSIPAKDINARIAARVKALRAEQGMTLDAFASAPVVPF